MLDCQVEVEKLYARISNRKKQSKRKADLAGSQPVLEGERYHFLQSAAAQFRSKGNEIYLNPESFPVSYE